MLVFLLLYTVSNCKQVTYELLSHWIIENEIPFELAAQPIMMLHRITSSVIHARRSSVCHKLVRAQAES